jgi:hypothetical protein
VKKVDEIPIRSLMTLAGKPAKLISRGLDIEGVRARLRSPLIEILVADVGLPFESVSSNDRFEFFKGEVVHRICTDYTHIDICRYPGGYCYVVSEWSGPSGEKMLLFEMYH